MIYRRKLHIATGIDVQRSGLVDEATTASRCPVVAIGLRTAAVAVIDPAGRRHPERAVEVVTVALAVERSVGVRLDIGDFLGLGRKHHAVHKTEPAIQDPASQPARQY